VGLSLLAHALELEITDKTEFFLFSYNFGMMNLMVQSVFNEQQ